MKNALNMFLFIMAILFFVNLLNTTNFDKEISDIILSSFSSKVALITLYFFILFSILRFRDKLLNVTFPIEKINESPMAAAFYYGVSVFAFAYGISSILN